MTKRELKTNQTEASAATFLAGIADAEVRADCRTIAKLMQKATGAPPKMWGPSIVGFGTRTYQGASGSMEWMIIGFAPRKANITLYHMGLHRHAALLERLGKHKTGKGCLYFKRLADIDIDVLEEIITTSAVPPRG